jgi:hypothetical protein
MVQTSWGPVLRLQAPQNRVQICKPIQPVRGTFTLSPCPACLSLQKEEGMSWAGTDLGILKW